METLTGTLPSGLRPIARRMQAGDLSGQTRRIVIPRVEKPTFQPEPVPTPKIVAPPKISVAESLRPKSFYFYPYIDQDLLGLFPHGIHLTSEWLYIGRSPYNEIDAFLALVVNRDEVSKVHAALMVSDGKVFVADLGSSNGTSIIRDQKVFAVGTDPVELTTKDILGIGPILFRIVYH